MNIAQAMRTAAAPLARRRNVPSNTFTRTLTARVIASVYRDNPEAVASRLWPNDQTVLELLQRAASAPAMIGVAGWAAELARLSVADVLEALGPVSSGAQVLGRGLVLNFDGNGTISVPALAAAAGNAGFVAEGAPIPVKQLAVTPAQLLPYKLASIAVLTHEMITSSNAEALISDALVRAAGAALDAVLFDANAATAARPAGLRNGIATLTASNNTTMMEAIAEDIGALLNAVAPVAGNGPYLLITNPGRAAGLHLRTARDNPSMTVFGSNAVGNIVIMIAGAALASALSPAPAIESSRGATLQMEDTSPQPPNTTGTTKSMFQTDNVAIKMHWPVTWALRDSRGVAWLTPAWK